jgi:hypothetical protein
MGLRYEEAAVDFWTDVVAKSAGAPKAEINVPGTIEGPGGH